MDPGSSRCEKCGASKGDHNACPFCRAVAAPDRDPVLRFACPACGAPRIPQPADARKPSTTTFTHLRELRAARSSQTTWRAGAVLTSIFALFSALLLTGIALITSPPLVPLLAGSAVVAAPFVFALLALFKAKALTGRVRSELDLAWTSAAHDVADRRGVLRVAELAEDLQIDKELAQQLISQLASHDDVATEITDSGELSLSIRGERLRVPELQAADSSQPAEPSEAKTAELDNQSRSKA